MERLSESMETILMRRSETPGRTSLATIFPMMSG